jgi:hypothetical protein
VADAWVDVEERVEVDDWVVVVVCVEVEERVEVED